MYWHSQPQNGPRRYWVSVGTAPGFPLALHQAASCFKSDLDVWEELNQRAGFLILGNGLLSHQTIFGVLYFLSFYLNSPMSSGYGARGLFLFERFPMGLGSFFLNKIHHMNLLSPRALLLSCVVSCLFGKWFIQSCSQKHFMPKRYCMLRYHACAFRNKS